MKTALVLMAAGLGSRYGGDKQITGFGPNNEILMDYAVFDGIRAGFNRFIFVIRPELEGLLSTLLGSKLKGLTGTDGESIEIRTVYQDNATLPDWFSMPPERTKPLGTVHAVLAAQKEAEMPFGVINADDYYSFEALKDLHDGLLQLPERGGGMMIAYRLKNTLSNTGAVTRGVCTAADGFLSDIRETYSIRRFPDGTIKSEESGAVLDPDCPVSMNVWGFAPAIFEDMERYFHAFLRSLTPEDLKKECILPNMVGEFLQKKELTVSVKETHSPWFGVTFREDTPEVRQKLKAMHDAGQYPPVLWGTKE